MSGKATVFQRLSDGRWFSPNKKDAPPVSFEVLLTALDSMCGGKAADTDLAFVLPESHVWLTIYKNGYKSIEESGKLTVFADLRNSAFFKVLQKTADIFKQVEDTAESIVKETPIQQAREYCRFVAKGLDASLEPKFVHIKHPLLE